MSNLIKKDIKRTKTLLGKRKSRHAGLSKTIQEEGGAHSGSMRPQDEAWIRVFGKPKPEVKEHKKTPSHGLTQVHKDKSKYDRKVSKRGLQKDEFQ